MIAHTQDIPEMETVPSVGVHQQSRSDIRYSPMAHNVFGRVGILSLL